MPQDEIAAGTADRMKNATDFSVIESNITEIKLILLFLDSLAEDLILAHGSLLKFCNRIDEVERLDEAHLLPLALEIFGDHHFMQSGRYISVKKNVKSVTETVANRLNFDSYYSFILTDFFEGLHYGHYPRKCEICGKYFLMQSARRQKYCSYGIAPKLYWGKKITCRKYAAVLNRKEKAENDPIVSLYNRRCGAIRTEVGRCTISKAFGEAAKHLAKEYKLRALTDDQYAKTQYKKDMSREALYADKDGKSTSEDVTTDTTANPERLFFKQWQAEALFTAYETLDYRERTMVADHLGFCTECYGVYELGKDENGNSVKLLRKEKAYIDLAAEHMLSSPDTAFQIVNGAYEKMLIELAIDEYIHIVELRLTSTDNNSVTYEYCADHNNDWGKIHYTFGEDDYDVVRYIYADRKGDFFFATAGEWIMHNTGRKHIPRYMVVSL